MKKIADLKVALVHDDLVQWGGAEKVLSAMSEVLPGAPIFTSVIDYNNSLIEQHFKGKDIRVSFIQKIPSWRSFYKALLPLYPIAFEQFVFDDYDLVISQSSRFAKAIITKPETTHIGLCLTPPRFLWNFSGEKVSPLLNPYLAWLRIYDRVISNRVDLWWANSKNTQSRVREIYQASAKVLYPFVDLEKYKDVLPFDGGYLLVISRLNKYKRIDLVINAAKKLGVDLKIVGVGPERGSLEKLAGPNVSFLGRVGEDTLIQVIAGCKALVVPGEEDFGMTPLEAYAFGKPVLAYKLGGALETVIEGKTGYFFELPTVESLTESLVKLDEKGFDTKACLNQAKRFSKQIFKRNFLKLISQS